MQKYLTLEKRVGYTPLQELDALKIARPELAGVPLTYAGRLDPMASGKLLVLIGDECKERSAYDHLDKEYEFEVLLGFESDTGDVLGFVQAGGGKSFEARDLKEVACSFVGRHAFPYPAFSSKTVHGKPLFEYALAGTLDTIDIPTTDVRIYKMQYLGKRVVSKNELIKNILEKIDSLQIEGNTGRVANDFRKGEIIERWQGLEGENDEQYVILRFKTIVSSGTYIRTLAPLIAEKLGTQGIAYSIHRTRIGRYHPITKSLGFWSTSF